MTYTYLLTSQIGQANGACPLNASGEIDGAYIDNIPDTAMASGASVNGMILTADGAGGTSYASVSGGASLSAFLLMGI